MEKIDANEGRCKRGWMREHTEALVDVERAQQPAHTPQGRPRWRGSGTCREVRYGGLSFHGNGSVEEQRRDLSQRIRGGLMNVHQLDN